MPESPGGREVGRLSIKILPDTTGFVPKLEAFVNSVETKLSVEIPVELELTEAFDELRDAIRLMNGYAHLNPVQVDVEMEVAGAIAHLDTTLLAMQGTADMAPVNVELELDTNAARNAVKEGLSDAARQGASSMAQIGRQIALWGPLILIAAVGIAALAPALAVVFPLVAGIAASGAVIALGFKDLKKVFKPLVQDFKDMRKEIGGALTSGLGPFVAELRDNLIPVLRDGLVQFASFVNGAMKELLGFLSSASGVNLIGRLLKDLGPALEPFAKLLPVVLSVFLRLSIAALPALEMMGNAMLDVTRKFNRFLAKGTATDTITQSMTYLGETIQIIGRFVGDIFPALFAAAPAVIALLAGMFDTLGSAFKLLKPFFAFLSKHKTTMGAIGAALAVVVVGLGAFAAVMAVVNAIMAVNPFVLAAIAIVAVAAALVYAYKHSETFRGIIDTIGATIATVFGKIMEVVGPVIAFVVEHWKLFAAAALLPIAVIVAVAAAIVLNFGKIKAVIVSVFSFLQPFILAAWSVIKAIFRVAVGAIVMTVNLIRAVIGIIRTVFNTVVSVVTAVWGAIKAVVRAGVNSVLSVVRAISGVVGVIRNAFTAARTAVVEKIAAIVNTAKTLPSKIISGLGSLLGTLKSVGSDLIRGLINGIGDMAKSAVNKVKDVVGGAKDAAKHLLGIGSPSKLFHQYGVWTIEGYQLGLESQASQLNNSMASIMSGAGAAVSSVFDPNAIGSAAANMSASIGAIVDNTDDKHAQEVIINWNTGRGVMMDITDDQMARKEFVAAQDALMGANR